jgi:hypothetical protein
MPIGSFMRPGAFDSEAAMSEALDAVFEELRHAGPPKVVREIIATPIINSVSATRLVCWKPLFYAPRPTRLASIAVPRERSEIWNR